MSGIKLFIEKIVTDNKTGKVVYRNKTVSESFVLQFLQFLEVQVYPSVDVNIQDFTDTTRACQDHATSFKAEGAVTDDQTGIIVGTGTTPVASNDVAMETLIAHGTAAGELSYGAMSKTTTAIVGVNVDLIMTRTFNNGSGSTINVTEVGIQCYGYYGAASAFLIVHDVSTAVPVANGQTLTVNYTFRTTV